MISIYCPALASVKTQGNPTKREEIEEFKRNFNDLVDRFSENGASSEEIKRSIMEKLFEGSKLEPQIDKPKGADYVNTGIISSVSASAGMQSGIGAAVITENLGVKKQIEYPEEIIYNLKACEKAINTGEIDDYDKIAIVADKAFDKFCEYERESGKSDLVSLLRKHVGLFEKGSRKITDETAKKEYEAAKNISTNEFEKELKEKTQVKYGSVYNVYCVSSRGHEYREIFQVENNYNNAYNKITTAWNDVCKNYEFTTSGGSVWSRAELASVCKNALKSINEQLDEARKNTPAPAPATGFDSFSKAAARTSGIPLAKSIIKYCIMKEITSSCNDTNMGHTISNAVDKACNIMKGKGLPDWIELNFIDQSVDMISELSKFDNKTDSAKIISTESSKPEESDFTFDKNDPFIIIGGRRIEINQDKESSSAENGISTGNSKDNKPASENTSSIPEEEEFSYYYSEES